MMKAASGSILLFLLLPSWCYSLLCDVRTTYRGRGKNYLSQCDICLNLVPISRYNGDFTFLTETDDNYRCCIDKEGNFKDDDNAVYELALINEEDLPDLSRFVIAAFGADAIRFSQDITAFERMLLEPATEFLNGYSNLVAFGEVFSGTKQRVSNRLKTMDIGPPNIQGIQSRQDMINEADRNSLVLALARKGGNDSTNIDSKIDIIASIELRLQPSDAKIPFSLPWLDKVERRLAGRIVGLGNEEGTGSGTEFQPYLSNLCVDERFRGKKIGRALVRCVENIAKTCWGYNRMYLHVDEDNKPALSLYETEGYRDVGHRWNPIWAGRAADIGYFVKSL